MHMHTHTHMQHAHMHMHMHMHTHMHVHIHGQVLPDFVTLIRGDLPPSELYLAVAAVCGTVGMTLMQLNWSWLLLRQLRKARGEIDTTAG